MHAFPLWVSVPLPRALVLCVPLVLLAVQRPVVAADPHPVQARLVADVSRPAPGGTFDLGLVLEMAPRWHTYWAFSGDAGLPTQVEWEVPEGFQVGPLQWPGPRRYQEAGDLTVFGYADEVMLITTVRAPDPVPDRLRFTAQVSWLVCADICIPGDTTLSIAVTEGAGLPAHPELFAHYRPQLPRPLAPEDPVRWEPRVRLAAGGALDVSIDLQADYAAEDTPDFYPLSAGVDADIDAGARVDAGAFAASSALRILPSADRPLPAELQGLVVFADAEGRRQYRSLRVDLTETRAAPAIDLLGTDFTAAAGAGRGLWLFVLMAALGGLILNLMPCVLPVISLKALSLVSQAGEAPGRVRQLGLAFTAGILSAFLGLALLVVLLKAGGEQVGWGFQFQAPAFVLFLTSLIFVLGLSLFGVVTVRLPGASAGLGGRAHGAAEQEGLAGSFCNGVLATILATPCTAPFLGSALGFAFSQPAPVVFAIFGAAGTGMALPYLALAWQPGWARFLPRPGPWMERFKQGMGFLLMATVLWLLWVLGKQLGMEAVVWTGAFLLCLALGAWLLGSWVDLRSTRGQRRAAWAGALALAAAGYLVFLHPLLSQPEAVAAETAAERWEPFDVDRVEAHIAEGRIVFVDFTAEWCWTCKVNELTVLADAEVLARFAALDVALVKADWTNRNPEITRLLRAFGRSGVPLYVIFPGGRPEAPLVLPEVITKGLLLDRLEQAARASRSGAPGAGRSGRGDDRWAS